MTQGFVCDRCGAAIFPDEHTSFALVLKGPDQQELRTTRSDPDSMGIDLCPKCARSVATIVRTRIITTETQPRAFYDSEVAGEPDAE